MDKSKKNKTGEHKFIDYVVKDMIKDIIVEKDFIDFAMPYNIKPYPSETRTGIVINYYRWFENSVESLWHRETILEDIGRMVQWHFEAAYGIPWGDTKEDNTIMPISLKLYDIIVKKVHKLWDKKSLNESKEDEYIDKIVDQLISETSIIKKKRIPRRNKSKWIYWVINPFLDSAVNFNIFWVILRNPYPGDTFQKHCMEIYGATPSQIKDIWDNYCYYLPEIKPEFNDPSKDNHWIDEGINKNLHESIVGKDGGEVIGKEFWFEYHCWESHESCDAQLWNHSHQKVKVLERGDDEHDEYPGEPKIYKVRFEDGWEYDVFEDELMDSPKKFYRPDPQPKQYHKNGFINRIVNDFLKLTEIDGSSIVFHTVELMLDTNKQHWNNPSLYFVYDTNGLTKESIDLIHEGVPNGVQWYMGEMGLLSSKDDPTVTIISDILVSEIIKGIENYMEDDRWEGDDWRDSIYLAESKTDKQKEFLNKILKQLIDNTYWEDDSFIKLYLDDEQLTSHINYRIFEFRYIPAVVLSRLQDVGLDRKEVQIIWDIYSNYVLKKIIDEGNMNWTHKEYHSKSFNNYLYKEYGESKPKWKITESTNSTNRFAKKIADEISNLITLTGELMHFHIPGGDVYSPVGADVNQKLNDDGYNPMLYHLKDELRGLAHRYLIYNLQLGLNWSDPLFKQIGDLVIDNILYRLKTYDKEKEDNHINKLMKKNLIVGRIRESTESNFLNKIYNSVIKEIRFDDIKSEIIIPFITKSDYNIDSGELEYGEYKLLYHDKTLFLRDNGVLHEEFNAHFQETYGLSLDESNELFKMVRQYIKDELYYKTVLKQILWSVQDDYIEGYGAKIEITPERTMDLKNYNEFKEYVDWYFAMEETDDDENNMVKRVYDELWKILKGSIINETIQIDNKLVEGWPAEPDTEIGEDGEEYVTSDRMFPDKFYLKIFKMIDRNPVEFIKNVLHNLGFESEEEFDILYNYFINYDDRKSYYLDFTVDGDDISKFFDNGDYGLEDITKNYLEGEWDYFEWYHEPFPYDDYMLHDIDDNNWKTIMKILEVENKDDAEDMLKGNENKKLEDHYESFEDIIEDTQRIIAQSATDAQSDADISYLHEDILGAINDMFIDGEFNFDDGQYQGQIEIGDLISKNGEHYSRGLEYLQDELESGYPDINDVSYNVLHKELEDMGWLDDHEILFTSGKNPVINTDKHFRYGGAGTMNEIHFNDMLADRLSWDF